MSSGLTIRVDRFGQVRVVPAPTHFGFRLPMPPDSNGVYLVTEVPA